METIGERVRRLRVQRVLGQGELARAAGITPSALYMIEAGQRQPRPATIRKLAEALGVPPSELAQAGTES